MTETVERVAKAIYEGRNGRGAVPWAHRDSAHREPYIKDARAAIAAMARPDVVPGPPDGPGIPPQPFG